MLEHDVIKTSFSQEFLAGVFWTFGGRRQIDAGEGTKSFESIYVAVFELSRKTGKGADSAPPWGAC